VAIRTVRDLLTNRLGVPINTQANRLVVQASATAGAIMRQDAARVAYLVVNLGAFPVFIAPGSMGAEVSASFGIRVEASGGSASMQWDEDGEIVCYEWRAIAVGGASALLTLETLIDSGRPKE